jgi:hypothetical protein
MNAIPRIPPLITIPHTHHNISQNLILLPTNSATINPTSIHLIIHTIGLSIPLNNDPKN